MAATAERLPLPWLRWFVGTTTDPKWRVVARKSGQPITAVIAVWATMLERASSATPRGTIAGWCSEDVAAALDLDCDDVEAILSAMQGKVLAGDVLTGWGKRQPAREDQSAERVRAHRERKKAEGKQAVTDEGVTQCNAMKRDVTQCNAVKRSVTQRNARGEERREEETREEKEGKKKNPAQGCRLDRSPDYGDGLSAPDDWTEWAAQQGHAAPSAEWEKFRDYWIAMPGQRGSKADWPATWRNWVRRALNDRGGTHGAKKEETFTEGLKMAISEAAERDRQREEGTLRDWP